MHPELHGLLLWSEGKLSGWVKGPNLTFRKTVSYTFACGLFQSWTLTRKKGEWCWTASTPSLCTRLSWWLARSVGASTAPRFILKWRTLVCNFPERCYDHVYSQSRYVIQNVYFSPLRCGCCCGNCNRVPRWTVTGGHHRSRDLFLQQKVRSFPRWLKLRSRRVIYSHKHSSFFCRLKGHFWPAVPDPANSSIKRWTSESTQVQTIHFFIILSHFKKFNLTLNGISQMTNPVMTNSAAFSYFFWFYKPHFLSSTMKMVFGKKATIRDQIDKLR